MKSSSTAQKVVFALASQFLLKALFLQYCTQFSTCMFPGWVNFPDSVSMRFSLVYPCCEEFDSIIQFCSIFEQINKSH